MNGKVMSEKMKSVIQDLISRRRKTAEMRALVQTREQEITRISSDQDRIRKNMEALDKGSALYKRYVSELDTQETHLDQLRRDADRLREQADAAQKELADYLQTVNVAGK